MPDASAIQLLALDVDGVLTDGSIYLDDLGHETKRFHVRDGFGIRLWKELGLEVGIITGRSGQALRHRLHELKITHCIDGCKDKPAGLAQLLAATGLSIAQTAYLGDDWPDLGLLRTVAYPMAVADADPLVLRAAAFTTAARGGHGAVREAIDHLIAAKGLLPRARALYDPAYAHGPAAPAPKGH
jgi:3-deoxy-D-manno-octulosonate 8-phosphate phosphatase (KDO 8-P phosphatase)